MPTECGPSLFEFAPVETRRVVAGFDGGAITSDAGALLLGATERAIGLVRRFAGCFRDARAPERIEHDIATLVGQRVFGIALGYEDLIDHDQLYRAVQIQATAAEEKPATAAVTGLGRGSQDRQTVQVLSTVLAFAPSALGASILRRRSGLDLDRPLQFRRTPAGRNTDHRWRSRVTEQRSHTPRHPK